MLSIVCSVGKLLCLVIALLPLNVNASSYKENLYRLVEESNFQGADEYLNSIKGQGVREDFAIYEDLYEVFSDDETELFMLVRVHVADILFQSYKNGYYDNYAQLKKMYRFSLSALSYGDLTVQRNALQVIGHADTEKGFDEVLKVISTANPRLIAAATLSAVSMCTSYDSDKLDGVLKSIPEEVREMVNQIRDGYREQLMRTSYCRNGGHAHWAR